MCCCGLCWGWGVHAVLSSHAELVQKHVCLPSSASQCLTMVSLAGTETAFLERLCHLQKTLCRQKDHDWCPLLGLDARDRQLMLHLLEAIKATYHLVQEVPGPQNLDDWWHILGHTIKLTLFLHPSLGVCCVPQLELGCWVRWDPDQDSPLL